MRYINNDRCYERCRRRCCKGLYHLVERGDTLYSLSRRYKVSVDAILRVNPGINMYNLRINDEICIPVMMNNDALARMPVNNFLQDGYPILDEDIVEMESEKNANYFSENDSVKDMLKKTGLSMAELLDYINQR